MMRVGDEIKNLVWWKMPPALGVFPKRLNLGDALSPFIVQAELDHFFGTTARAPTKRLLAIGSILHKARDGDVIWGTGSNGMKADDEYSFANLDVRAVRGPITADLLRRKGVECPEVFGDPAILLPLVIPKPNVQRGSKPLIIPHFSDRSRVSARWNVLRTEGSDFHNFVRAIVSSPVVYSASLHGIIIAESYGVPAVLVTNAKSESEHKYRDYYESTGRSQFATAETFDEAAVKSPPAIPDLSSMRHALRQSFPYDLWNGGKLETG